MLKVQIKTKIDGEWIEEAIPETLTGLINMAGDLIGKESIMRITTSKLEAYLCGTEALVEMMKNTKKDKMCISLKEAHYNIEHHPDEFFYVVQTMSPITDIFPPKPEQNVAISSKGWEHLKDA
jgi:hypothetical protein